MALASSGGGLQCVVLILEDFISNWGQCRAPVSSYQYYSVRLKALMRIRIHKDPYHFPDPDPGSCPRFSRIQICKLL
jgi:hypothetical protein